ncbi:MAG: hypothetical protein MJ162_07915 [Treponema sp.]|nr:hypothetical protein [Treponema sp.]
MESSSLFEGAGCSVNVITVKFCENLGISLSSLDRYMLLKGDDLSNEEQLSMTEEELDAYKSKLSQLEQKLKQISVSADVNETALKAKLEAQKALLEQQQAQAKERLARLQKERQQYLEDQRIQNERSEAQKKKIAEVAAEAEKKAAALRKNTMENLGVDGQIAVIEAKKRALVEIRQEVDNQIDVISDNYYQDYLKAADEIDSAKLRPAETDADGRILPEVQIARNNQKKKLKEKYDELALRDINALKKETLDQENSLLAAIAEDQNTLKKKRSVSSLTDPDILYVGNYDGKRHIWEASAALSVGSAVIVTQSANLSYEKISGKPFSKPTDSYEVYNDYLDTVDMYDSMFRRKVPVVALEVEYVVEALPENYPSQYRIVITSFKYVNVISGETVQAITPTQSTYAFAVNPAIDLRTSTISANRQTYVPEQTTAPAAGKTPSNNSGDKKTTPKLKKETKGWNPYYDQRQGNGGRLNIGILTGPAEPRYDYDPYSEEDLYIDVDLYLSVPLTSRMFMQLDVVVAAAPDSFNGYYTDEGSMVGWFAGIGFNQRIKLFNWYPELYCYASLGAYTNVYDDYYDAMYKSDPQSLFSARAGVGIDLPFAGGYCFTLETTYSWIEAYGADVYFNIGIALSL